MPASKATTIVLLIVTSVFFVFYGFAVGENGRHSSSDTRKAGHNSQEAARVRITKIENRIAQQQKDVQGLFEVTSSLDLPDLDVEDNIYDPPTLRSAIQNANFSAQASLIVFGAGVETIQLTSALPNLITPMQIDGTGSGTSPVVLDGSLITPDFTAQYGLFVTTGGHSIKNLEIRNFPDGGIVFSATSSFSEVKGCRIHHNGGPGINVNGTVGILIGGSLPEERNYQWKQAYQNRKFAPV